MSIIFSEIMPSTALRQFWSNYSRVLSVLNIRKDGTICKNNSGILVVNYFSKSLDVDRVLNTPLNSVIGPEEPVTSNNFFLSLLWIISPTYRLTFVCMDLHLVSLALSQTGWFPLSFFQIEKECPEFEKNALIIFFYPLNFSFKKLL